jgi:hypothetical protein
MAATRIRKQRCVMRWASARVGLLVGIALFTASGFCADPAAQTISNPADAQSAAAVAVEAAEKAAESAVGKSVEQAVEKAAEKAVEKTVEAAVEAAVVKASAETALQSEQAARRPDEWKGPTRVQFLVFIIDVDDIDDANQNFTANVYIRLRWNDRRLAQPGAPVRQLPLESVWNPRVLIANATGVVPKSLPDVVQVEADGTVIYHQRYTGKFSQPLRLSEFPRDQHTFLVHFVAAGYNSDQMEFIPDVFESDTLLRGGSIADELSLTDWKVLEFEALPLAYRPIKAVHTAGFGARFIAGRQLAYYLWQVVLPMAVVVVMSWAAFWVGRDNVGVRIGVATSSVLTLIANRFVLASLLPRLPYMTRMDYFTVGSTLLVFLALFMVVMIGFLDTKQKEGFARKLDLLSRAAFPSTFLLLLGWFVFG